MQFHFNRITVEDGLTSQSGNYYILHDSENMVWISSLVGLNRFDGNRITSFLPENIIQSNFFEDNQKRLWFGTDDAMMCYDLQQDTFYTHRITDESTDKEISSSYQPLYFDSTTNYLWFRLGRDNHIYKYHITSYETIRIDQIARTIESKIVGTKQGDCLMMIPSTKGLQLTYHSNLQKKNVRESTILKGHSISSFHYQGEDTLWVAAENKLFHYNPKDLSIKASKFYKKNEISSINGIVDPGGSTLIISTPQDGIYFIDKNSLEMVSQIYSFSEGYLDYFSPTIDRIHLDKEKNLWISTKNEGIFFANLKKRKFSRFLTKEKFQTNFDNKVISITENSKGQLLVLTSKSIQLIDRENNFIQSFNPFRKLSDKLVPFCLRADLKDNLFCSSNYGLFVKKASSDLFEKVPNPFVSKDEDKYSYIIRLQNGSILVSSFKSGLFEVVEKGGTFSLQKYEGINKDIIGVTFLYETSNGDLIVHDHANEKILVFQNEVTNGYRLIDSVSFAKFISGIAEDKMRKIFWVATDIGLHQLSYNADSVNFYEDQFFIEDISAKGILISKKNTLWLSSNNGLISYQPHQNQDSIVIHNYNVFDGLQSLEFNLWSSCQLNDDKFAFGGVNGLNVFDPKEITPLQVKPNPTITQIRINNISSPNYLKDSKTETQHVAQFNQIELEYDQNDLSIDIAPREYSDPSAVQYYFQMVGKGDTIERRIDHTFDYPNMQPGQYTLTYNASNSDGIWFEDRAKKLQITILSPWWQRWWAYLLYLLIGLGIIYAYYRFRIDQIQKKEAFKRKEAEFQKKEAEYKQQVAETETAILRLQMNPHFIFNSMNSISSYILQRDIETANNYLLRFAKLMRMILNFAEKPMISVADEVELLEQYLTTEAMRFEKKFTYSFEFLEGFDPDEYLIPTMILQPFVENAIWHGMMNKVDGEGKILIKFWEKNNTLNCSIEDNGVGRVISKHHLKSKQHQSKATSITHRRLAMIQPQNGIHASFQIKDLVDQAQQPSGTLVLFQFPIF